MEYIQLIELDVPANALIIKSYKGYINSIIKIDDKEIEEIKLKKEAVSFFTISKSFNNPIKPEFTILLYTLNNIVIEMVFECDEKKELENLEEYIKNILI